MSTTEIATMNTTVDCSTSSTPLNQTSTTRTASYIANTDKIMRNKVQATTSQTLTIERKHPENLVLEFSTGGFECYRGIVKNWIKNLPSDVKVDSLDDYDQSKTVKVAEIHKVFKGRKINNSSLKKPLFTINLYLTKTKVLINGSTVNISDFVASYLPTLLKVLTQNLPQINLINKLVAKSIYPNAESPSPKEAPINTSETKHCIIESHTEINKDNGIVCDIGTVETESLDIDTTCVISDNPAEHQRMNEIIEPDETTKSNSQIQMSNSNDTQINTCILVAEMDSLRKMLSKMSTRLDNAESELFLTKEKLLSTNSALEETQSELLAVKLELKEIQSSKITYSAITANTPPRATPPSNPPITKKKGALLPTPLMQKTLFPTLPNLYPAKSKIKTVAVIGDSNTRHLAPTMTSTRYHITATPAFTTHEAQNTLSNMKHPYDAVVVHTGTNNLKHEEAIDVANNLCSVINRITHYGSKAVVSLLLPRGDANLSRKIHLVNHILRTRLSSNSNVAFTSTKSFYQDHSPQKDLYLKENQLLHLNDKGVHTLGDNIRRALHYILKD